MTDGRHENCCKDAHLILMGAPGSGKGTLAAYLKEKWGLLHISTGDILRAEVKAGSVLGKEAQSYMERGALVPDDLIIRMMEEKLKSLAADQGYILDGFPRTLAQAEALGVMLQRIGQQIDAVVNMEVPHQELIRRLTGRRVCPNCNAVYHIDTMQPMVEGICDECGSALVQRKDDQLDAIENRLATDKAQRQPLVEYYRERGKLVEVDGTIGVPQVAEAVGQVLCGGA
ncbi:MAG: adenylate kinase [Armatimonadota bacterium]